jgi:hypothetical protein
MANGKLKLIGSGRYQAADTTHLNPSLPKAGVFLLADGDRANRLR